MQQDTIYHPFTWVNGYLCFVKIEKIFLLDNGKLPINMFDAIIDVDGRFLLIETVCSQNRQHIHCKIELRELMMLVQRLDCFRPLFVRGQNEKAAQLSEFQIAAPL